MSSVAVCNARYRNFKMSKNVEQRVAIEFCFKAGKSATETIEMLKVAYDECVTSRASVFRWCN